MSEEFLDMRITPRQCGGWIAIFDNGSMRFGVTADSEQAARDALKEAEASWRRIASLPLAPPMTHAYPDPNVVVMGENRIGMEEMIGELKRIIRTIREMDDEYNRDEECDYAKINGFIELLSEQADEAEVVVSQLHR